MLARINGPVRVLFKTRLIFPRINGSSKVNIYIYIYIYYVTVPAKKARKKTFQ